MVYRIPDPPTTLRLPMSGERLEYNLNCIGWTFREAARRFQVDLTSIVGMSKGQRPIPDRLALHVEKLAAYMRANSQPDEWDSNDRYPAPNPPFYAETTFYPALRPEVSFYKPRRPRPTVVS